ncbi:hypothetical protein ACLBXO_11955 [Methylobacterium sp. C33D]
MGYKHTNPQNRMRAAALLRHLKGRLIDVTGVRVEMFSNTAASAEAYWQLSKARGVHLYQEGGGWHADLEFGGLPPGIGTIIGTPAPVATRAEAIESVVGMMSICAQRDTVPPPDPATGLRWFRFDEHEVPVDAGMLADYMEKAKAFGVTRNDAVVELMLSRREIAGSGPVTRDAWAAASFESRYQACKVCCMAMALGIRETVHEAGLDLEPEAGPALPGIH